MSVVHDFSCLGLSRFEQVRSAEVSRSPGGGTKDRISKPKKKGGRGVDTHVMTVMVAEIEVANSSHSVQHTRASHAAWSCANTSRILDSWPPRTDSAIWRHIGTSSAGGVCECDARGQQVKDAREKGKQRTQSRTMWVMFPTRPSRTVEPLRRVLRTRESGDEGVAGRRTR